MVSGMQADEDALMTDEQIDAIAAGDGAGSAPAVTESVAAQPESQQVPADADHSGEPPAGAAPAGDPAAPPPADQVQAPEPGDDKPGGKWDGLSQVGQLPKRLYTTHLNEVQKETIRLMAVMPNVDPAEVAMLAKKNLGRADASPAPANGHAANGSTNGEAAPAEAPAPSNPADLLSRLEAELAEVDDKLNEAAEADGVGTTFNREVKELLDKRQELLLQRSAAQREATMLRSMDEQRFENANQRSIGDAQTAYPDLQNEDTPLHKAVMERFAEVEAMKRAVEADRSLLRNPDVQLRVSQWNHPNFPRMLADEVARDLGIAPVATAKPGNGHSAASQQGGAPAQNGARPAAKPGPTPVPGSAGAAHRVSVGEANAIDRFTAAAKAAAASDDLEAFENALDLIPDGAGGAVGANHSPSNGRVIFVR